MAGFGGWQPALLKLLGMPMTRQNLQFLTAWQGHEGGGAAFNPLNTTQHMPGASDYNSVGVRNYPTAAVGLAATARTLRNGYYPGIMAALKSGNPTWNARLGANLNTWGTGSSFMAGYRGTNAPTVPAQTLGGNVASLVVPKPQQTVLQPRSKLVTHTMSVFDPMKLSQGILGGLLSGDQPDISALTQSSYKNISYQDRVALPPRQVPVGGKMLSQREVHTEGPPIPGSQKSAGIVGLAAKQLGQPYVWGGESRKEGGFDCSGLVDWAMRQQGYRGPRLTTYSIAKMGTSVRNRPLQPGDLVLSNGGEHVSIYAGNGKCIVAPHTGAVVRWQPLSDFHVTDIRRL